MWLGESNIQETLSFYWLLRQHDKHMKPTNMLERLNEEFKRRTRVVRIFPNSENKVATPPQGDLGRPRESRHRESDGGEKRRGRRPAWFCQEQTNVLTEQFSSMERDAFHVSYLSDKIREAVFYSQPVKTVAYLRVSTAQQDLRSQRLAILEYARKHDFRIDDFIEATASGQPSERRRRLDELMNALQRGDRLCISR